jgi:hypothetical protein
MLLGAGLLITACGSGDPPEPPPAVVVEDLDVTPRLVGRLTARDPAEITAMPGGAAPVRDSASVAAERREVVVRVSPEARLLALDRLELPFESTQTALDLAPLRSSDRGGIEEVLKGRAAAALITVDISDRDRSRGLCSALLGHHVVVLAVRADSPVRSLTVPQAHQVLVGAVREWNEIAYHRGEIEVVLGPKDPLSVLAEMVLTPGDHFVSDAVRMETEHAVLEHVAGDPDALGVVSLVGLQRADGVRAVALDGVLPDVRDAATGRYHAARGVYLAFPCQADPAVHALLDFARGERGRATLRQRLSLR